ncbi:MAG TPA: hopanoid-associated sugar epimerase [Alphaproteobacteria bacterium]|nr:hopanoid-associated sugar epimerase [Alphaproteobacteria bacterium]
MTGQALVTGGTGFVGSAVVRKLLARGRDVRALARPASNRANLEGLDIEIVEGDLKDPASWPRAFEGVSDLYHVAADYRLWVRDPAEMYRTNVEGTEGFIRAAADAGVGHIVYTSSVATLGILPGGEPADEDTPVALGDMIGHYKRSKYLGEQAVRRLAVDEKIPVVIVNPSTPIGPRDIKPTPTGRIVLEAAQGKMPAYVDTGLNVAHVDDVAEGHILARERGRIGERYVLGGDNMSLKEILVDIAGIVGRKPPLVRLPANAILPLAYGAEIAARLLPNWEPFVTVDGVRLSKKLMFFKHDKAARELGYTARPAHEALADAIAWYRAGGLL